jgi:hypothetical protein
MRRKRFLGFVSVVLAFAFITGAAYPYAFIMSQDGNYLRWSADDLPVNYRISNWWLPPLADEPLGAIYAGFRTWENVAGASVSFNYEGVTKVPSFGEQDGRNVIGWNAEAFIGGTETGAFGVCQVMWYDTETWQIDEADIALNIIFPWTTTGEVGKYDIQGIVTHEVGHLLGLDHSTVETATMIDGPTFYGSHNVGDEVLMRTLDPDDIAGISILYPLGYPETATGRGGPGGGCFIATAAYGSGLAGEVRILSDFRDGYLLTNSLGRNFVRTYYRLSPSVAGFIAEKPLIKFLVRMQLRPWVKIASAVIGD